MTVTRFLLKEYGSWGVMLLSFLAGIAAGGGFTPASLGVLAGLALSINAKQAFTEWMRGKGADARAAFIALSVQALAAAALFWFSLGNLFLPLLPYAAVPVIYLLLLRFKGEHALVTEAAGFFLLSLSALVSHAAVAGMVDPRLYVVVAVFFTAGVFKVRIQFRKRVRDRVVMVVYLAAAVAVYVIVSDYVLESAPLLCLLPLTDNLVFALWPYSVKLKTTGWIEVSKGAAFVLLVALLYR